MRPAVDVLVLLVVIVPLWRACTGPPPRWTSTRQDAQTIRSAAWSFQIDRSQGAPCPTVLELVQSGELDPSKRTTDAWGRPFVVECHGDDVEVRSAGPDRRLHTEDDIIA